MKKVLLLAMILLVSMPFVYSNSDFDVYLSPESRIIKVNQTATFNLTVDQYTNQVQYFDVYCPEVEWDMVTEPSTDRKLKVYPKSSASTTIKLRPLYVNPGVYGVSVNVRLAEKNTLETKHAMIEIKSSDPITGTYLPSVRGTASMKEQVNPKEDILVRIKLENQNRKDLPNVIVKLRSNLINKDYETSLLPLEKKTVEFKININPLTHPQTDILKTYVFIEDINRTYQFDLIPMEYEILKYGDIEETIEQEKSFLTRTKLITLTNSGNEPETKAYRMKVGLLKEMITSAEPEAMIIKTSEGRFYSWDIPLDVNSAATITVTTDYRPVVIALLIIIIGIILYYLTRSPITIRKSAVIVRTKEGGISDLKVMLMIKNRSGKAVSNVEILDKVPSIAEIIREEMLGTLQPVSILKHEKKGTLVKWMLDEVDKREERIISYKIRSKLSILGGMTLPVAIVKFHGATGKEKVVCSNRKSLNEDY